MEEDIIGKHTQLLIEDVTRKIEKLIERGLKNNSCSESCIYDGEPVYYTASDGEIWVDSFIYEITKTKEYANFVKTLNEKYHPYIVTLTFEVGTMDDYIDIHVKFRDSWLSSSIKKLTKLISSKDGYTKLDSKTEFV